MLPMISDQRKQSVREKLANVEELALQLLTREAKGYAESNKNAPEAFYKKLKIIGDQIRVDFRVQADQPAAGEPLDSESPQEPFRGLRVVSADDDAA